MEVLGDVGVSATLFGYSQNVLEMNAYIANAAGGINGESDSLDFLIMGQSVWSSSGAGLDEGITVALWSEEKQYMVECIPVWVTASVTGSIGVNVNFNLANPYHPTATETPYAALDFDASAGIGTEDVSAGIEGSLTLVRLSTPFVQDLNISTKAFSATTDFSVSTLSGELDLYAEAGPFKATKQIASWNGYSHSTRLVSQTGSL
jgi:hypothetical protein